MFQTLSNNLGKIFDRLRNRGVITAEHLDETMREVRIALLEADVALPVIKEFISAVRTKAEGQEVIKSISPGQLVIKIINDELVNLLSTSPEERELNLKAQAPVNILMAGLQGSGKTTSSAKLALRLKNQGKRVLLVSLDIYRPAAREQLTALAGKIGAEALPIIPDETVRQIVARAQVTSRNGNFDIVIYDSAGRLHIDEELIDELKEVKATLNPTETLLVVDSLTGQDAVNIAAKFNESVGISGIILTRIDGDNRGGAALSVKYVTKAPIKFVGVGEGVTAFEPFQPERIASRILGMGDVVSLVEKAISVADQGEMEKVAKKLQSGKFDLNDYASQIKNIQKLGGMSSIASMLPGMGKLQQHLSTDKLSDKPLKRQLAIISSMTKIERKNPDVLNASRRRRIAEGAGTTVAEVNKLMKQYIQIAGMLKKAKSMNPANLLKSLPKMF